MKEGNKHIMVIKDLYGEDADEYCCRAQNKAGSRMSRADLTLKCMYCIIVLLIMKYLFIS